MTGCNIVTISKVETIDDKSDTVEFSKVYNALITNPKTELYLNYMDVNHPDMVDTIMEILNEFTKDIVEVCYTKVKDISIEIDYDVPMNELKLGLKLLLTHGHQIMDEQFFSIAVDLSEKYEEKLIALELFSLSIEFDTELKGEYTKLISVEKTGQFKKD